jgi:hypothetical protein
MGAGRRPRCSTSQRASTAGPSRAGSATELSSVSLPTSLAPSPCVKRSVVRSLPGGMAAARTRF